MTRLIRRCIEVGKGEIPEWFRDGEQIYQIQFVLDEWQEMGDWWDGEETRRCLRVITYDLSVFELECVAEDWFIYRIWD